MKITKLKENFYEEHEDDLIDKHITEVNPGEIILVQNGMYDVCLGKYLGDALKVTMNWDQPGKRYEAYEFNVEVVKPLNKSLSVGDKTNDFTSGHVMVYKGSLVENTNMKVLKEDSMNKALRMILEEVIEDFQKLLKYNELYSEMPAEVEELQKAILYNLEDAYNVAITEG